MIEITEDQRFDQRIDLCVEVDLTDAVGYSRTVQTGNVSNGGLFLVVKEELPPVGSVVTVKVKSPLGCGEDPPANKARVVRHATKGIGLQFIFD